MFALAVKYDSVLNANLELELLLKSIVKAMKATPGVSPGTLSVRRRGGVQFTRPNYCIFVGTGFLGLKKEVVVAVREFVNESPEELHGYITDRAGEHFRNIDAALRFFADKQGMRYKVTRAHRRRH